MTYEERLEVFEKNRRFAEIIAVRHHTSELCKEDRKAAALRCLWRFTKTCKNGLINNVFLKGVIVTEIVKESKNFPSFDRAVRYIKAKKEGEIKTGSYSQGHEIQSLIEHGKPASIDNPDSPVLVKTKDRKDKWFECIPDGLPEDIRDQLRMRFEGYELKEIGDKYGVTPQAIHSRLRSYIMRNRHKFDGAKLCC